MTTESLAIGMADSSRGVEVGEGVAVGVKVGVGLGVGDGVKVGVGDGVGVGVGVGVRTGVGVGIDVAVGTRVGVGVGVASSPQAASVAASTSSRPSMKVFRRWCIGSFQRPQLIR